MGFGVAANAAIRRPNRGDTKPTAGQNWSRVANLFAKVLDTSDPLNPAGAAIKETMIALETTLPLSKATFIVDMGCGNGPLIGGLLDSSAQAATITENTRLVAADVAESLLDMLRERKSERSRTNPLWNRLEVQNWDAKDLREVKDGEISHIISSYAYYAFRDENVALAEAFRVLQPGGFFAETSMRDTEWAWLPEHFLKEVRPDITLPGPGEHWYSVDGVTRTLENAGFKSVQVKEYDVSILWDTYEDMVTFIFDGIPFMKPLIADWSDEEVAKVKAGMMKYLTETHAHEPFRSPGKGLIGWATK